MFGNGSVRTEATIVGILLAAGSAARYGGQKLLEPLPDGTPIAIAALRTLLRVLPRVVAVVNAEDETLAEMLAAEGAVIVTCSDCAHRMGRSIAAGVSTASEAEGWLVALADMPFVRPETISIVARRLGNGAVICAPCYRGQRGHPVGFAACFHEELLAIRGDTGARGIIDRNIASLDLCECDDAGVLRDIDTPADLRDPQSHLLSARKPGADVPDSAEQ